MNIEYVDITIRNEVDSDMRSPILEMMDSEGWHIVEKFIKSRMEYHKNQAAFHCQADELNDHRARYKAYNSVFIYINDILNQEE